MRSAQDKALAAIAEDRVRVVRAVPQGIALHVTASRPDPETLQRPVYKTYLYVDLEQRRVVRACSCPAHARCYHIACAELVWQPGVQTTRGREAQ